MRRAFTMGRGWHRGYALVALCGLAMLVNACGSSSPGGSKGTQSPSKTAISASCLRIGDVLSDGPDPASDPVGYALAQVRPLQEIKTSDRALHLAIEGLATAYETVYKTNDQKGAAAAVKRAGKRVDAICPGAF